MNRICFRFAIARPEIGFDYFGGWFAYDPLPVLSAAARELAHAPDAVLRLQYSLESGGIIELGWNASWLNFLAPPPQSISPPLWRRHVVSVLLSCALDAP